ncbi:MAG: tRNA (adenosine(37)-N6)-threonylcarbamoyltransferase complex dimerization subunit type 1 TsaB [Paludibacteraceae bacterium]|nr:tRNA (adenosine(37)-N6)-threonylcarbamoyltransferase complex dimerization subunit type 1 TsaB [Paludibacteraceae bacterium]
MISLNIETSTDVCSAALTEDGNVLAAHFSKDGNHARQLPVFIDDILAFARREKLMPEAVAISEGPGSYTGLRIGTATAKGLCYGLGIPLIALPTLRVLCEAVPAEAGTLRCPMIDARRMEVYCALFADNGDILAGTEAKVIDSTSFADRLARGPVVFFGNGAAKCKTLITSENARFIDDIRPDAANMGKLAAEAFAKGRFADIAYFDPFYLKEFQATVSHKAQDVLNRPR